jgi:hypothetical protein
MLELFLVCLFHLLVDVPLKIRISSYFYILVNVHHRTIHMLDSSSLEKNIDNNYLAKNQLSQFQKIRKEVRRFRCKP